MKTLKVKAFSDMEQATNFVRKHSKGWVPGCEELLFQSDGYIIAGRNLVVYDPDERLQASMQEADNMKRPLPSASPSPFAWFRDMFLIIPALVGFFALLKKCDFNGEW